MAFTMDGISVAIITTAVIVAVTAYKWSRRRSQGDVAKLILAAYNGQTDQVVELLKTTSACAVDDQGNHALGAAICQWSVGYD